MLQYLFVVYDYVFAGGPLARHRRKGLCDRLPMLFVMHTLLLHLSQSVRCKPIVGTLIALKAKIQRLGVEDLPYVQVYNT